ncbi:MAG: ankyrin repeat domain-containing protein [Rickettsiaceae bacterium]|nr:ankyrin repeat domain-containing protein [Rickettsiaceae bacterium]
MSKDAEDDDDYYDGWIQFHQSNILDKFPEEHRIGVCWGLCLEYARYISKERAGNKKAEAGTPQEFINKINRKFLDNNPDPEYYQNLQKRLMQYQTFQDFYDKQITDLDALVELVKNDNYVHKLGMRWEDSAHSITIHKLRDETYVVFDPNYGVKIINGASEFKKSLKKLITDYQIKYSPRNSIVIDTINLSQLVKDSQDKGDFIALHGSAKAENKAWAINDEPEKLKTPKYLEPKKAAFAALRQKLRALKRLNPEDLHNIDPGVLAIRDIHGRSLLHLATLYNHSDVIEKLVTQGNLETEDGQAKISSNINFFDKYGYTPLDYAYYQGQTPVLKLLVEKLIELEQKPMGQAPPNLQLFYAIKQGNWDKINELIEQNASIMNLPDQSGKSFFHWAIEAGDPAVINMLLLREEYPKSQTLEVLDNKRRAPLFIALESGSPEVVEILLAQGADINSRNQKGLTPLHVAVVNNDIEMISALLTRGPDLEAKEEYGYTPLHIAIEKGNLNAVNLLLEKGANLETKDDVGLTPLHIAIEKGNLNAVNLLLAKGANLNAMDELGATPLHNAITQNKLEVVKILLANGADPSIEDISGKPPLYYAKKQNKEELIAIFRNIRPPEQVTNSNPKEPLAEQVKNLGISWTERTQGKNIPNDRPYTKSLTSSNLKIRHQR